MISKHSHEQSEGGEGVEVVKNEPCEDPVHGAGQYTEKKIHLFGSVVLTKYTSILYGFLSLIYTITGKFF